MNEMPQSRQAPLSREDMLLLVLSAILGLGLSWRSPRLRRARDKHRVCARVQAMLT